jgi:hypothetical protein
MRIATRRGILISAAVLAIWAIGILVTGGFVVETPWGRLSSRAAIRPLIGAGLVLLFYVVHLRQHWKTDIGRLDRVSWAPIVAAGASVLAVAVGLLWGTRIAGGPDASGYVSEAALFARGELTLPVPTWVQSATWDSAAASAAPVGYTPSPHSNRFAPAYAPGLPLLMAAFQIAAGASAVFFVVPLLGGIAVWATWLIGKGLGDARAGAIAAVLVAISPTFIVMLLQPMSDVPAAAFWSLAVAASLRRHTFWAGLASGAAILVRPNTAPLAAVPLLIEFVQERQAYVAPFLKFAAGVAPAAAGIGILNWYYYGSPLQSGYGSVGELFSMHRVRLNAEQYWRWFFSSQTPLPLLGLLAPAFQQKARARLRTLLLTTILPCVVLALYLPYEFAMPSHDWTFLRFMLPAYPSLMIGFAIVVCAFWRRAPRSTVRTIVTAIVLGGAAVHGWQFAQQNGVFHLKAADQRYARAVAYAESVPANSVFISLAHSGTLRLYTGRDVLRTDAIAPEDIDSAMAHLETLGYRLFFIGDLFEMDLFRKRYAGTRTADRLDTALIIELGGSVACKLSRR